MATCVVASSSWSTKKLTSPLSSDLVSTRSARCPSLLSWNSSFPQLQISTNLVANPYNPVPKKRKETTMAEVAMEEREYLACCGSAKFAKEMAKATPFTSYDLAVQAARDIWFNKVDVNGWLEAFAAHPAIGQSVPVGSHGSKISAQWSKGEQSTALATANDSTLQELSEWNAKYRQKFGFVFLICASGRSSPEILAELKQRFSNRPILEFEIAAQEQMKITELRLLKLIQTKSAATDSPHSIPAAKKMEEDRVTIIGGHLTEALKPASQKSSQATRPPITTHVLDVAKGSPAAGVDVSLEMWAGNRPYPSVEDSVSKNWTLLGSSITDNDGRSGQLMVKADFIEPGVYKISFDTGKYCPGGFFPYVSIVFEIKESQKFEHFHVPLLFSPFSFTTYRGS